MRTADFYYDLPQELIAQDPLEDRSSSRLMHISLKDGSIEHRHFTDILDYLNKGDCLVINDSKVLQLVVPTEITRPPAFLVSLISFA